MAGEAACRMKKAEAEAEEGEINEESRHGRSRTYDHVTTTTSQKYTSASTSYTLRTQDEGGDAVERRVRLVKLSSDILKRHEKVAIIDCEGGGTSIGRDKAYTPRIRLPVMKVSKHHCNVFCGDGGDEEAASAAAAAAAASRFYIADTGSTYGTFVRRSNSQSYHRLSPAKQSSPPFELFQGDVVKVDKTTFEVHIHPWPFSCSQCALDEGGHGEIPLSATETAVSINAPPTNYSLQKPSSAAAIVSAPSSQSPPPQPAKAYLSGGSRRSGDRKLDASSDHRQEMKSLRDWYLKRGAATADDDGQRKKRAR